jgi:hypothetical protein
MTSSFSPHPPKQRILTISSHFTKMPYSTQLTDVGNQLATTIYGAQSLVSIIGKAQNVQKPNLENTTIRVIMPCAKNPVEKQRNNCQAIPHHTKRKWSQFTFPCQCTKCYKPAIIDQTCIDVVNAITNMINHGISNGVVILYFD